MRREATNGTPRITRRLGALTPRETEVAMLVKRGFTNKEVARHLGGLSDGTVKLHIHNILRKIGGKNRYAIFKIRWRVRRRSRPRRLPPALTSRPRGTAALPVPDCGP
jgi:DNA-binding NarL/FixJ family response regulator